MITLFLVERGRISQPLLYLSAFIEANKRAYYECLQRTRTHGGWRGWIVHFLQGFEATARLAANQVTALIDLRDRYRARFASNAGTLMLIDALFENPLVDAQRAARVMKKTAPTARAAIAAMEREGGLYRSDRAQLGQALRRQGTDGAA